MIQKIWFYNEIISVVVVTWFIAQFIKFVILLIRKKKIDFKIFFESGRMPSVHTAVVCSLALSIGISQGFYSIFFAIAAIFAVIVVYDALGVRRSAGDHAHALNKIVPHVLKEGQSQHFKTRIGHKPSEVIAGAILGLTIPLILMWNKVNIPKLNQLFKFNYLFNLNPGPNFFYMWSLIVIFFIMFLAAIVIVIVSWRNRNIVYKKLFSKIYTMLITIGLVGLLLLFFRYENVYFLSGRFLLLFLVVALLVWLGFIVYYGIRKFPLEITDYKDFLRKEKYIPKSK